MIETAAPFRDDEKAREDEIIQPTLLFQHRKRSNSMDSNSSWGSNKADVGCYCISHNDDEVEVAKWLVYGEEIDWAVPPSSLSEGEPSEPPFNYYNTPATLLYQLFFAILTFFGLIPNHPIFTRPLIPQPFQPRFPIKKIPLYDIYQRRDPDVRVNGTRILYYESETYHLVDDIEYVVSPKPGTNQREWRIPLTTDCTDYKLDTHLPGLLRVYRMPWNMFSTFSRACGARKLVGLRVRPPTDMFDHVTVVRQGYVTSESPSKKEEYWMLMGTDPELIRAIAEQTDAWPRSFFKKMTQFFRKALHRSFSSVANFFSPFYL